MSSLSRLLAPLLTRLRRYSRLFAPEPLSCREDEARNVDLRLREIDEHLGAIRELAEERAREVDRYRDGYNLSLIRSFARGVIRAIDLVDDYQQKLSSGLQQNGLATVSDSLKCLAATRDQLILLLESNQIEQYTPSSGDSVREESRKVDVIETHPSANPGDVGRIKEVRYPGYVLTIAEGEEKVIRKARVAVFSSDREGSKTP
ncbi:MAG: hypothetical protein ACYTA3_00280 [Planctomycetota bacterium]|jgi:molecular chaperone GrpE (heat shock protein)